jgi:hypothetical protein
MYQDNNTPSPLGEENSAHVAKHGQVVTEPSPTLIEFFRHVLPREGWYCWVALKKGEKPRQGFVMTIEELATVMMQFDAAGYDAYFSCASYKEPAERKAPNVKAVRCLWNDIDYGAEGHSTPGVYSTKNETMIALDAFCDRLNYPYPSAVSTGGGVHAYWRSEQEMTREAWELRANHFKATNESQGLHADPVCTANIVCILRAPGTHNYKIAGRPRPVTCDELMDGEIKFDAHVHPVPVAQSFNDLSSNLNKAAAAIYSNSPPTYAEIAATKCNQLAHFRKEKGKIAEPVWYASLGVLAYCDDGEQCAHEWSSGHPTYSREETDRKLKQARDASDPITCNQFKKINPAVCIGCPHAVTSPIVLGRQPHQTNWPEPNPIRETLQPVAAFDAERLLPDALRGWIMDEANRMPCPPDFIAAGAIVGLGSLIGARCAVKPKKLDDWVVVANLWGGVVALPSAKKSPAIGAALKPLDRLAAKAIEKNQAEIGLYEAQKTIHEAKEKDIKSRIGRGAKNKSNNGESFAQELVEHRQQSPTAPNLKRYKTNDTTVEKLGELLRDNPAGLLVIRDELVGLIASWDKEGREGDRAFFLEAWNGNASYNTDRIGRGSVLIPNLCASIFGGIQPDKLIAYLEQASSALENDGMLQRFQILVYPDPYPWEYRDRTPNQQLRDQAYDVFAKLATIEPANWGAHVPNDYVKFPYFSFSSEAQAVFIKFSEKLHRVKIPAEATPIIQQHLAKYDKLFPALALILHLVECAATGQRGPISHQAALRAEAWCEYLETHARRCYGLLADRNMRAAQALAQKISQGDLQDGFTARDVNRKKWRSLTSVEIVEAALDTLEDEGWVMSQEVNGTGPGGGRRTFRYFINPKAVQSPKLKDGGN